MADRDPLPLKIIDEEKAAQALLDPPRRELAAALREPQSAAGLAERFGLPRQRVNYHLRALEDLGLLELAGTRKRRNCTERLLQLSAEAFCIDPGLLEDLGRSPRPVSDRFDVNTILLRLMGALRDVLAARRSAERERDKLVTLAVEADLAFESRAQEEAFLLDLQRFIKDRSERHPRDGGERRLRLLAAAFQKRD